jgi:hypothetical protein
MHSLLERVVQTHFRKFLDLREEGGAEPAPRPAYTYRFEKLPEDPEDPIYLEKNGGLFFPRNSKEMHQVDLIHKDLCLPIFDGFLKRSEGRMRKPILFVCHTLGLIHPPMAHPTVKQMAALLLRWVSRHYFALSGNYSHRSSGCRDLYNLLKKTTFISISIN